MISVNKAKKLILQNLSITKSEIIPIGTSLNRIVAKDVISPIAHPFFDQSAVDGYGISFKDINYVINGKLELNVIGEIKAGDSQKVSLKPYQAVRIFTGAPIPQGCDTVIMQEDVARTKDWITFNTKIKKRANIRKSGDQIKKGEVALKHGTKINSAVIGFMSSLGIKSVPVSMLPSVGIIVTGSEFYNNSEKLIKGKIYESNGKTLQSCLKVLGIKSEYILCEDSKELLLPAVRKTVHKNDITIITGGVSVGDYDFTKDVIEDLGFSIIFHNVEQKPGKPLLFAKKGNKTIFGLPGNPGSVLVCYYEYIYSFLQGSLNSNSLTLKKLYLPLLKVFNKNNEKVLFLSGKIINNSIGILDKQDSHMLKSFTESDALIYLPEGCKKYYSGELVEIHLLNNI